MPLTIDTVLVPPKLYLICATGGIYSSFRVFLLNTGVQDPINNIIIILQQQNYLIITQERILLAAIIRLIIIHENLL